MGPPRSSSAGAAQLGGARPGICALKRVHLKSLFLPTCRRFISARGKRNFTRESEVSVMNKPVRFMIIAPLLSAFMATSLSAFAQEPRRPPPGGPHMDPHMAAMHHRFDPHHFDRHLWGLGRAYPYGCRWGRCGYWWFADGYWYFYDHALNGPPEAVSDYAYDDQGNVVPMEGAEPVAAVPPPPPPPPGPPPEAAPNPVAGAIVGGALGGIVGGVLGHGRGAVAGAAIGATTGAVVAAEAQPRPGGYYWWRGGCYYRYPDGTWSQPLYPSYCGY
jgi:hypothetical protein